MNGHQNIKVQSFDLPGDVPPGTAVNGGVLTKMALSMHNPSPFGMTLGSVVFDLYLQGTFIGQAICRQNATLFGRGSSPSLSSSPSSSLLLTLEGTLYRQTDPTDLDHLSTLISNYLRDRISSVTAKPVPFSASASNSSLVNDAIMASTFTIPLQSLTPPTILHDVQISHLGFTFSTSSPYGPTIQFKSMSGAF